MKIIDEETTFCHKKLFKCDENTLDNNTEIAM